MTSGWDVRPLTGADREVLRTSIHANVNWTGEERLTYAGIDGDPALLHYTEMDAGRGDFGVVAHEAGRVLGVVWVLFLGSESPGFGFVREGVPELSVSVWPGYRGRGIGRALLARLLAEARARGVPAVGLSVERGNPAVRLYRALGFAPVPGRPADTLTVALSGPLIARRREAVQQGGEAGLEQDVLLGGVGEAREDGGQGVVGVVDGPHPLEG